ncbi:MAG: 5-(carboxyamino)imidazole ribonucleotide synthase [Nitriliruptor sp.]|nr:MAG: 5-(carboxyamino)imidazole ribonucleotide synthase [Nitriliruptor sp.]
MVEVPVPGAAAAPTTRPASTPTTRPATARVGMVGGGQLARMTHAAAIDLGVDLYVLAVHPDEPAPLAGAVTRLGSPDDLEALRAFAVEVDVVTLDHELVSDEGLAALAASGHPVRPSAAALLYAKDKLHARTELAALGLPVPPFAPVDTVEDVTAFATQHGWPVVCKATRGGYDGRGVEVVHGPDAAAAVLSGGGRWMVEAHVDIAVEVAVVTARRPGGEHVTYPVVETVQQDGQLVELVQPARIAPEVAEQATALGTRVAEAVDGVGIVAVELFIGPDGTITLNELALRPHNSGHATIEAATTSQFHNHLRAVLDWPLGDTSLRTPAAALVNLLGPDGPDRIAERLPAALAISEAAVHLYGKASRPGRKIGHVTVLGDDAEVALSRAREVADLLLGPGGRSTRSGT